MARKSDKIVIDNFSNMRPDLPTFSVKNTMYAASGVNPLYYIDNNITQEETIVPLAASIAMTTSYVNTTGTITDIVSVLDSPPYAIADNQGYVVNGSASSTKVFVASTVSLDVFNNYTLAASSASGNIAYAGVQSSTFNMAPMGLGYSGTFGPFLMFNFVYFGTSALMICYNNFVYAIPANLFPYTYGAAGYPVLALTLPASYSIIAKPEIYVNYASVPYALSSYLFNNNYLALWNGATPVPSYNILLPGRFVGQVCIGGTLYIVVEERAGVQTLGYLKQYQYIRKRTLHGTFTTASNKIRAVFNAQGYVGVNTDLGLYLYKADPDLGEIAFLYDTNNYSAVISASNSSLTDNYSLYGVIGNTVYTTYNASLFNPVNYKSQYVQVTPYRLKIWYNSPPQSTTDAIYTTLYGIDEYDSQGNLANEVIQLNAITNQAYDTNKSTILDCQGFTGDKMSISLTTVNSSSWRPVIKRIEIIPQSDN